MYHQLFFNPLPFTGFGLLESGSVSSKNEVNIMVKNAADVIFGGLSYWAFGYAISFGTNEKYIFSFYQFNNFNNYKKTQSMQAFNLQLMC